MRQTARRATRAADPTDNLTSRGKPHEPRGTEEKQPRPAMPTATPNQQDTEAESKQTDKTSRPTGAERGQRTTPQATSRTGRERTRHGQAAPLVRQARRGERTSGETINETINGGRPTGLTRMTTPPPDGKQAGRRRATTPDDETEPRRQHPMTISP